MNYRIGVVTGSRADYGILKPLIEKIFQSKRLKLCLIVTGMHFEARFGNTYKEIEKDGFPIEYQIPMDLTSDKEDNILKAMGDELTEFGRVLKNSHLSMMIILGDRFEILIAAIAATIFKIPIAHIHGGELTEGAIDESIRHSITKMSSLHFPATEIYAKRIIQMGEQSDRVFNVGALGVENIKKSKLYNRQQLIEKYGLIFKKNYVLVTYHPVTLENNTSRKQFSNLLEAIQFNSEFNCIFTYANADTNGKIINRLIDEYVLMHRNSAAFKSLGQIGYLSAMRFCEMIIGNSSSGLIEAPSFGIPTINIGDRQKGRIRADSVIDCGYSMEEILSAFDKAKSDFKNFCSSVKNPYQGKDTSESIIRIIID